MLALPIEELGIVLPIVRRAPAARRLRLALPRPLRGASLRQATAWLRAQAGVESVTLGRAEGRLLMVLAADAPLLGRLVEVDEEVPAARRPAPWAARRPAREDGPPGDGAVAWHALEADQVLARLGVGPAGLTEAEAEARLRRDGPNAFGEDRTPSGLEIAVRQVANLPSAILLASAGLESVAGELLDALAIGGVVGLDAAVGFHMESDSERVLAAWRRLEAGSARVLRGGAVRRIAATDLVRGDLILCKAGDVLAADARVLEAHRLTVNEAPLTGESEPQRKGPSAAPASAPLAERTSMLFAGTAVSGGHGRAVITAAGRSTELARVRALVEAARPPETPLERRMDELGRAATVASLGASALAAGAALLRGMPAATAIRSAIALGVAAIPEGLPLVVTTALVRAMGRLRDMGMVVRRMASVETLGGVTIVCADKTGTLTQNDMRLEVLEIDGTRVAPAGARPPGGDPLGSPASRALAAAVLTSDLDVQAGPDGVALQLVGSSTERALALAAQEAGLDVPALRRAYPRIQLHERGDGVHYVVSRHRAGPAGETGLAFVKGAPEQVVAMCDRGPDGPLDGPARAAVLARNEALATEGLRVLALGWRPLETSGLADPAPRDGFELLGLAGLRDPLRPGAADAVRAAHRARIRTLILTGDQRATAAAVAREVGLTGDVLEPADVERLLQGGPERAADALRRAGVVARVTPQDKMRIVLLLRAQGEVVAMVGDGINDAPALKVADVGVAVGAHASGVARQVADVVMASEDLRSILTAVGEGRIVQDNLRRTVRYLFATNLSEILLVLSGAALGVPTLGPMQLLWTNLVTDSLPALALALEPGDPRILDREPAPPGEPVVRPREWRRIVRDAAALAGLGGAALVLGGPTAAFAALPAAQIAYAESCRAPSAGNGTFAKLVGGAAALHAAAVLGTAGATPAVVAALAAGLAWPALGAWGRDEIVVKGGSP